MKRIVAAVDLSEPSLRAVDLAADLASKYDAELVLLIVGQDAPSGLDAGMEAFVKTEHIHDPVPALVTESIVESMRNRLSAVRERAAAKGARHISTEVSLGEPAERILFLADATRADLIAMGSRGHGRLAGLLLGSVAQKVLALARCAVLVVH